MSRKKPMTREEWKRWRDRVNTPPPERHRRRRSGGNPTPMFDPVPPESIRELQGGAPGMGKKHGKRR